VDVLERIVAARTIGDIIAGVKPGAVARVGEAAAAFGLLGDDAIYTEIAPDEASAVLTSVIHHDMAYHAEIVSQQTARELAEAFVGTFDADGMRFFTNGTFGRRPPAPHIGRSWRPATAATYDTGVLVLGPSSFACLWFLDED